MKKKTQQNPSNYDNFNVKTLYYTPPVFTNKKMNKKWCKSPSTSSEMTVTCKESNPNKWTLGSLINALPLTPSPVCNSTSSSRTSCSSNGDHGSKSKSKSKSISSSSSLHECDFVSRASHEFFTPTHQLASVLSSTSFRKQEQSPKRKSISTYYESTFDHQEKRQGKVSEPDTYSPNRLVTLATPPYDHDLFASTTEICDRRFSYPLLPSGSKERVCRWSENNVGKSLQGSRDENIRAMEAKLQKGEGEEVVVEEEEKNHSSHIYRSISSQDFSDGSQKPKRKVELDALYKSCYTDLLNKLKKKEADIDSWESNQRIKAEYKLDRVERKLGRKKAKATQKMHQNVAEAKIEAERRKYKERESVMKKVVKLCQKSEGYKPTASVLRFPWSSGRSQYTPIETTPRAN